MKGMFLFPLFLAASMLQAQTITLAPVDSQMACVVRVPNLGRANFILGLPETIGSSEGMILNFPEASIRWEGPDVGGAVRHTWRSPGKVEYTLELIPAVDYVDAKMTIRNIGRARWTNVFSFNCLNPGGSADYQDWNLSRTWMSQNGRPFKMDGTTRVNTGPMKTVQFYLNEGYGPVSPFINGFSATSPDKTDDSYIVTMAPDGMSYMAATSPKSCFLFNNLDRCCLHSAASFGDIEQGGEKTVTSRFYFAEGSLEDFLERFRKEVKHESTDAPRILMCYGDPWALADTTLWREVYNRVDILKIYIGDINERVDKQQMRTLVTALLKKNIHIAIELGGLLDWHASKGDGAALASFRQDWAGVKPLIDMIREVDPSRSIDMLDMDGPIRRMLFPNNKQENYHTIESAVVELFKVLKMWKDSIPGIEINLLTNFPNWAWGSTPSYFSIAGNSDGYGQYMDVLEAVRAKSLETGLRFDGLTVDNPYDYALGRAQSNQSSLIAGVDWMKRIHELDSVAVSTGMKVNMIFNTNGARNAQMYSEQTLAFIDLYHQSIGKPDGYWIQSWYQLPGAWLPETTPYTMTNIVRESIKSIEPPVNTNALLEPEDGRVYHGVQTMTFAQGGDPLAGYLGALADSTIQPAVRGLFFSIPGTRGPANSLRELGNFFRAADSIGFIPELSLFLVSDVATDSIIAVSAQYDSIIDSIITLCKDYGRRMFLRIGGEFNGAGPNWNGGGYHPYLYVTMFRKIVDMFAARDFRDSIATIWCYYSAAANDFDSVDTRGARWYPGDGYVDWFGLDLFNPLDFDLFLPDYERGIITRKGKSQRFLAMARQKDRPVYMSETSAAFVNITPDSDDGVNDWNAWFAKFWSFIAAHPEIKGFSYIDADWPERAYPGWGDARIESNAYITTRYKKEMKNPKYIHLPVRATTGTEAAAAAIRNMTLPQNFPNPFIRLTSIPVEMDRETTVALIVFDSFGRRVRTLHTGPLQAGAHTFEWDGRGEEGSLLPPGIYFARLLAHGAALTGTMVMMR